MNAQVRERSSDLALANRLDSCYFLTLSSPGKKLGCSRGDRIGRGHERLWILCLQKKWPNVGAELCFLLENWRRGLIIPSVP